MTVIENVGLQVVTEGTRGGPKVRLLEWPTIREVLIVEGARRFQYIFYMVVRLADPRADLVVLFPVPESVHHLHPCHSRSHA